MLKKTLALVLCVLISTQSLLARSEESIHFENPVYQTLYDYNAAVMPVVDSLLCASYTGVPGAITCFLIGSLDEALLHYGYTNDRHFSAAIFGMSLASTMNLPYFVAEIVGASVAFALSTGSVEIDRRQLEGPLSSALVGTSLAHSIGYPGYIGLFTGLTAFALDSKISMEPSFSLLLAHLNTLSLLYPHSEKLQAVSSPLVRTLIRLGTDLLVMHSFSLANHGEGNGDEISELSIQDPESLKAELDTIFKRLIGSDFLQEASKNQFYKKVALVATYARLTDIFQNYRQSFFSQLPQLKLGNQEGTAKFFSTLKEVVIFIVPLVSFSLIQHEQNKYDQELFKMVITDSVQKKLSGENSLVLNTKSQNNTVFASDVANFKKNMVDLTGTGIAVLQSTTDDFTKTIYSSFILYNAQSFNIVSFIQHFTSTMVDLQSLVNKKQHEFNLQKEPLDQKLKDFYQVLREQAKTAVPGRHQEYLLQKISEQEIKSRELEAEEFVWSCYSTLLQNSQGYGGFLLSLALVSLKAAEGKIPSETILTINNAAGSLADSGNWNLKYMRQLFSMEAMKNSVNRVLDHLDTPCDSVSTLKFSERLTDKNALVLRNFKIGIISTQKELLSKDEMEIPAGRYVVTGVSGSGKTSFLNKIRGVNCNGIYAHGEIEFQTTKGGGSEVQVATQDSFIPPYSSLIEILTDKTSSQLEGNLEIRKKAKDYILKLRLDADGENGLASDLDSEKNWGFLSGGQKKKIALIRVLLKKPKFLILDETFAGLDPESVKTAEELIREELWDSVIFIVDHNSDANDYDGFYQGNLHLENATLVIQ